MKHEINFGVCKYYRVYVEDESGAMTKQQAVDEGRRIFLEAMQKRDHEKFLDPVLDKVIDKDDILFVMYDSPIVGVHSNGETD